MSEFATLTFYMGSAKKRIRPHKGGRTETRLIQMTPETKDMLDEILAVLSKRAGHRVSFSDVAEAEIARLHGLVKSDPEGALASIAGEESSRARVPVREGRS